MISLFLLFSYTKYAVGLVLHTSFLHDQVVDQETKYEGDGKLAEDQSLDGLNADDGHEDRHDSLHLKLEQQQNGQ